MAFQAHAKNLCSFAQAAFSLAGGGGIRLRQGRPNSTCDVALPLELTSGLGRDRGESGGLRGVLVAPARRRVKLGRLFIGIVGSGCTRSRIMRLGLVRVRTVDIKGTGGITG